MDPAREEAIYHERHVKIICTGAGASGLCLAYKLQRSFRHFSLTIYDKNQTVGGTWYENRYPGCACDVPSHNYVYSFEPKADFASVYASSAEIQTYFEEFAQKYHLGRYLKLRHVVENATWDECRGVWIVTVKDMTSGAVTEDWCHFFVQAGGYLNQPAWPAMPGLDQTRSLQVVHSANYDRNMSLDGRHVLIIGAGSSAVQMLPTIQPVARSVTIFIRSPSWLLPDISTEASLFTSEQIRTFQRTPEVLLELRRDNERTMNSIFSLYLKNSVLQNQCRDLLESETRRIIGDQDTEKLIPKFEVGCKRVIPSGFKFLKEENVTAVYSAAQSFTPNGVTTADGRSYSGDVAICATGFNTSYIPRYPILGPEGRNLQVEWAQSITGYMGVGVAEYPNLLTLLGPYSPVSNGPTLIAIEAQVDYICAIIDRYQTEPSIHSLRPKKTACDDFVAHTASFMDKSVWTGQCRSSHNGHVIGSRIPTTWPGSTLHYLEAVREPRWDDWEVRHTGNRFSWMGNGISQTEWDPTADLGYYIEQSDDGALWNSRGRRISQANKSGSMPPRQLHRQAKLSLGETKPGEEVGN